MRASLHTLGCRLNQSETAMMSQQLQENGYEVVTFGEPADLGVINTCTVTAVADAKARNVIRSFVRQNPKAYLTVVGCYSQIGYKAIAEIPGVDLIIGNQEKLNLLNYISQGKNQRPVIIRDVIQREDFTIDVVGQSTVRTRANLKIQDGCDFMCSFCVIPFARGRSKSRQMGNLLDEARTLVRQGFKEVVMTGVNIGTYDYQGQTILDVIDNLNAIEGLERIRISSIEMTTIPEELLEWMNDSRHALLSYLHIPLQSASNSVLKNMKRLYTHEAFLEFVVRAQKRVPDLCVGTDVMVGFPGETDALFQETYAFLEQGPFSYFHVFPFSVRANTAAARMKEQVSQTVKKQRSARLRRLSEIKRMQFYQSHVGDSVEVLFEEKEGDFCLGYSANYLRVAVKGAGDSGSLENQIRSVVLEEVKGPIVEGCLC